MQGAGFSNSDTWAQGEKTRASPCWFSDLPTVRLCLGGDSEARKVMDGRKRFAVGCRECVPSDRTCTLNERGKRHVTVWCIWVGDSAGNIDVLGNWDTSGVLTTKVLA